ncbi:hypothetical protein JCM8547_001283 [Rhodosporidiobolus lusitaniae]
MPLLRRRPVQLLPLPNLEGIPDDQPVFYLKATGEVFLDYDAYAARLSFLLNRVFQCEYSGKTNLDYFSALQSEKAESRVVRERFPDELKGRVLATVQFRVMGRLDSLVDLVYERYKDRFFPGETLFVDLSGDKYFAKVSSLFPPQNVREQAPLTAAAPGQPSTSAGEPDYAAVAHRVGTDLNVDAKKAKAEDDPDEYLYTVQLMDEEHKFEGSFMEVKSRNLSRDRLAFSKSIMKRYMRECLMRDPSIGAPWMVKPSIARAFSIPTVQSEREEERNKAAKEGKLAKRRKTAGGEEGGGTLKAEGSATKRRKTAEGTSTPAAGPSSSISGLLASEDRKPADTKPKTIKYPIEDLDLDAMSIHDGRVLRRVNAERPPLPTKPQPKRDLLVPPENFDRFIETWNLLNVFSKPLHLSTFSLDDYAAALKHDTLSPHCVLLTEIHASLTNVLGTDNSRVLGSTTAVSAPVGAFAAVPEATPTPGPEGETPVGEGGNPLEEDQLDGAASGGGGAYDGAVDVLAYEQSELNRLVRLGISYGKRWDRQAKLKYNEGREGWERHLVGALCQRGGPVYLENFVRIMRHLFAGHPNLPERQDEEENGMAQQQEDVKPDLGTLNAAALPALPSLHNAVPSAFVPPTPSSSSAKPAAAASSRRASPATTIATGAGGDGDGDVEDTSNVEEAYLTLSLEDKLDIVAYLCTLVMGSKPVRLYIEEADVKLTELRKERADVNKEKKALMEQKTAIEQGREIPASPSPSLKPSGAAARATASSNLAAPASIDAMEVESHPPSEMDDAPFSAAARGTPVKNGNGENEDDEEDQLLSDSESAAAPSDADRAAGLAALRETARQKTKGIIARSTIDDRIRTNAEREDHVEREFRRYQGVAKVRLLGKDRFHCRYWWFDGVGGMELVQAEGTTNGGGTTVYGAGRVFVQGPSREDWEMICDVKGRGEEGEKGMRERRTEEEVAEEVAGLLGVNEWGCYEDEEELEALNTWLNSKGTRELALKNTIAKWRTYILAGSEARKHDAAHPELLRSDAPIPVVSSNGRRSGRTKEQPELYNTYMGWRNLKARY